jgi:hypothetical protein
MMTIAELSQYAQEHGNRLVAIEKDNEHCQAQHSETSQAIKGLGEKIDRVVWGIVGIFATALVHLAIALFAKK